MRPQAIDCNDKRFIPPGAVSKWRVSYKGEKCISVVYVDAMTAFQAHAKSCIKGEVNGEMILLPFNACTFELV